LWGAAGPHAEHGQRASDWLCEILQRLGGVVTTVPVVAS
jgi:hypothetical protein